jgi:hypothetical protein
LFGGRLGLTGLNQVHIDDEELLMDFITDGIMKDCTNTTNLGGLTEFAR